MNKAAQIALALCLGTAGLLPLANVASACDQICITNALMNPKTIPQGSSVGPAVAAYANGQIVAKQAPSFGWRVTWTTAGSTNGNAYLLLVPYKPPTAAAAAPAATAPVDNSGDEGPPISITTPPNAPLPVVKTYFSSATALPDVVTSFGTLQAGSTFNWPLNHTLTLRLANLTTTGISFTTLGAQGTFAGATTSVPATVPGHFEQAASTVVPSATVPAAVPAHYERLPDTFVSGTSTPASVPGHYEQGPSTYKPAVTTAIATTVPAYYSQGGSVYHRATYINVPTEVTTTHCITLHMLVGDTMEYCWDTTVIKNVRTLDEDAWYELTQVYHPASTITAPTSIPSGYIQYQSTPDNYWVSTAYTAQPNYSTTPAWTLLSQVFVPTTSVSTSVYVPSGYIVNPDTAANYWVDTGYTATPTGTAGWTQVNKLFVPATTVSTPTFIPAGNIIFEGTPNNTWVAADYTATPTYTPGYTQVNQTWVPQYAVTTPTLIPAGYIANPGTANNAWVSTTYTATPTTTTAPDQTLSSNQAVTSGGTVRVLSATFTGMHGAYEVAPSAGTSLLPTDLHSFRLSDTATGTNDLTYNVVAMITWADGHVETHSYSVVLHIVNVTSGLKL